MKNSQTKNSLTVIVVNPITKEQATKKIEELQKKINLMYGGNENEELCSNNL